ncbi:MAG: hypothetical protein QF921_11425 [Pseudomonadales bacterium]|nr:hypothetical protein [Pseudomonadales bacterium]MDP6828350.1 hypothetical protein [Pseudomonadales bacterium]MDP6972100.1 hypothetical protein [Pseudomonadales bacterium]
MGYTLFCAGAPGKAHLVDMQGRFVHVWQHARGIQYATLLSDGHLLCRATPSENVRGQRGLNGQAPAVFELDWDGT